MREMPLDEAARGGATTQRIAHERATTEVLCPARQVDLPP